MHAATLAKRDITVSLKECLLCLPGTVAIVSSGTSDELVAEECRATADVMGCYCFRLSDVSVDGLHRILHNLPGASSLTSLVDVPIAANSLILCAASLIFFPLAYHLSPACKSATTFYVCGKAMLLSLFLSPVQAYISVRVLLTIPV